MALTELLIRLKKKTNNTEILSSANAIFTPNLTQPLQEVLLDTYWFIFIILPVTHLPPPTSPGILAGERPKKC